MTIIDRVMRTAVRDQYSVSLYETTSGYLVAYGAQETEYTELKDALNGFNQCCLHAEKCAGLHDE